MNREQTFKNLYNAIHLENTSDYDSAIKNITKKLNESYYADIVDEIDSDIEHCHVVGSIGRGTAIKKISDVDMLFVLPHSIYERFNQYAVNGQSALLQDVKQYLIERYPRTEIKGDGQAVVIEFDKFSIDLVPVFTNYDGSFTYADSNNGGTWQNTNPISEQKEASNMNIISNNNYIELCNFVRLWKNTYGFIFGGILIDTFAHELFVNNPQFNDYDFSEFHEIIIAFLELLSKKDENNFKYYALGSNQEIIDKGKGSCIKKAKECLDAFVKTNNIEFKIETVYLSMFGNLFMESLVDGIIVSGIQDAQQKYNFVNSEEFIENKFPIHIKYNLEIDCHVTADGFRTKLLSLCLWLPLKRRLEFFVKRCNVPYPYDIYWKIRNVGTEAYKRNMIRGSIFKGKTSRIEHSNFRGDHYVECYIIKNGICVARKRLPVPINELHGNSF